MLEVRTSEQTARVTIEISIEDIVFLQDAALEANKRGLARMLTKAEVALEKNLTRAYTEQLALEQDATAPGTDAAKRNRAAKVSLSIA